MRQVKALPALTPEQITAARDWLAELVFQDYDPEEFAAMPEEKIVRGVNRHWDGGIESFLATFPQS